MVKNPPAMQETWVRSLGWEDPREGMATYSSYSCLENRHGQRSLVGYNPWGRKESDITERLSTAPGSKMDSVYSLDSSVLHSSKGCLVTESCLTLCNLMDCSPPGSSVRGLLQARILEWVAMPFSRGSSQPSD